MKDAAIAILLLVILVMAALDERDSGPQAQIEDVRASARPGDGPPSKQPIKIDADYPLCVTVKPPPLLRSPQGPADYRLGKPFNDKGTS